MAETQAEMASTTRERIARAFNHVREGRLDQAHAVFSGLMREQAFAVDAHRGMAAIAWQRRQADVALQLLTEAVRLDGEHADARADLALILMLGGRLTEAVEHWQKRLELQPADAGAWHNLGKTLAELRQTDEAWRAFEQALSLQPGQARTYITYARALESHGDIHAAEKVWRRGLDACPKDQSLYIGLAQLQFHDARLNECLETYVRGVQALPESAELHMGHGQLLDDLADKTGAEAAFRRALALRPGWAMPLEGLLTLLREDANGEDLKLAQAIMDDPQRPPEDHANVGFGLGKVLDRRGQHELAFDVWSRANAARQRQIGPYQHARTQEHVARLIAQFSPEFVNTQAKHGLDDPRPVFVVGMPRSGTSLVEQILAAHPDVHGFGELQAMSRLARSVPGLSGSIQHWPEAAAGLQPSQLAEAARRYLNEATRGRTFDALRFIDKAPMNFLYLGLAGMLFPQARVIWCLRDPRDVGISIYGENFGLNEKYACDLTAIAQYYQAHSRLLEHWQGVLGDRLIVCRYEELVADHEAQVRGLLRHIGLNWDVRCLKFFEDGRPVLTPSRWQVRQPIYQGAVGRWRQYEKQLQPLLAALNLDEQEGRGL